MGVGCLGLWALWAVGALVVAAIQFAIKNFDYILSVAWVVVILLYTIRNWQRLTLLMMTGFLLALLYPVAYFLPDDKILPRTPQTRLLVPAMPGIIIFLAWVQSFIPVLNMRKAIVKRTSRLSEPDALMVGMVIVSFVLFVAGMIKGPPEE